MAKRKTQQTIITDVSSLSEAQMKKIVCDFCAHLENGFSEHSFKPCDVDKIEEIITRLDLKNSNNYYYELIKSALRANLYYWEKVGINGLRNKKNFNSNMWMFYLKMKFNKKFNYPEQNNKSDKNIEIDFTEK